MSVDLDELDHDEGVDHVDLVASNLDGLVAPVEVEQAVLKDLSFSPLQPLLILFELSENPLLCTSPNLSHLLLPQALHRQFLYAIECVPDDGVKVLIHALVLLEDVKKLFQFPIQRFI